MQVVFTPHACYKWMRKLVIGFNPAGVEASNYIDPSVSGTITGLKYFVLGTGADVDGLGNTLPLTETWFRTNCKDTAPNPANPLFGYVKNPLRLFANTSDSGCWNNQLDQKELTADDFYNYGNSLASKVVGILGVTPVPAETAFWNIPGALFQVGCHLETAIGNYDGVGAVASQLVLDPGDSVQVNEIGIFDEDDVMILYGTFPRQNKNSELTLKVNSVAMLKTLDYQLV